MNLVCSPQRLFANDELIREFIAQLGLIVRSVRCRDIRMTDQLATHLEECREGKGRAPLSRPGIRYVGKIRFYLEDFQRRLREVPVGLVTGSWRPRARPGDGWGR